MPSTWWGSIVEEPVTIFLRLFDDDMSTHIRITRTMMVSLRMV